MLRRLFSAIDWRLMGAVLLLVASSLFILASIDSDLFVRQVSWVGVGVVLAFLVSIIDIRSFISHRGFIITLYALVVLLLITTLIFAPEVKGNRAWIMIGSFQFQASELAKVVLVLVLSVFFSRQHVRIAHWGVLVGSFLLSAGFAFFIALQPDLGSAITLIFIWLGFVLLSGIPVRNLLLLLGIFVIGSVGMWHGVLQDYQKDRILSVFSPTEDPLGTGYNVIQSKIAIGSGGLTGKGFGQGTQVQLGFLPEAHTDFIFSAILEEGGIVFGGAVLLGLFLLIFRLIRMGMKSSSSLGTFLCLGGGMLFFIHVVVNIGSALGLLPVIGVTLPFVSYGGSSMIMGFIMIGIIQSSYAHR